MTKKIKTIALIASFFITINAFAAGEGWFVGFSAGATKTDYKSQSVTATTNTTVITTTPIQPTNSSFGARLYTGYNFNDYVASEFGYTYFGAASYKIPSSYGIVGSNPQIHTNVFDILAKGMFPFFNSGLIVFGKLGMAVVWTSKSKSLYTPTSNQIASCQSTATGTPGLCSGSGKPSLAARPEVAFGIDYDFTPNWELELGASQVLKGGSVPSLTYISLGIAYHWVDLYCGQFLC